MKINILLIEDDAFKAKKISSFIHSKYPDFEISSAKSVTSGLSVLVSSAPDVLLLDMSLSTYDVGPQDAGGRPQNFGGITVLEHMARRKIAVPVIVITQFPGFKRDDGVTVSLDALTQELQEKFPLLFKKLLSYSPGDRQWESQLETSIDALLASGGK